jgi:hypothetical protein
VTLLVAVHHAYLAVLRRAWAKAAGERPSGIADHAGAALSASCTRLIRKARWRARLQLHDARLGALLAEVCERLDELDERLVRYHPVRDAAMFAAAARLHRELERIQASVSSAFDRAVVGGRVRERGGEHARPLRDDLEAGERTSPGALSAWWGRDGAQDAGDLR